MFLLLQVSFKTLSTYSPSVDHYPWNTESSDRPYELGARSVSARGNAEVKAFAKTDVMAGAH